jgi:hypothetical protein
MRRRFTALMRVWAWALAPVAVALAVLACAQRETPRHVRAERATDLPRDVLFYPHVLYGGDSAYLVEGRWYRPGASGWVVFTEEPLELEMLRHTLEPEPPTLWGSR